MTHEGLGISLHHRALASNDVDVHAVTVEESPREIGDIEDKHTLVGMTFPNMDRRTKIMFGKMNDVPSARTEHFTTFTKSPYRNGEHGWDWIRAALWELIQRYSL